MENKDMIFDPISGMFGPGGDKKPTPDNRTKDVGGLEEAAQEDKVEEPKGNNEEVGDKPKKQSDNDDESGKMDRIAELIKERKYTRQVLINDFRFPASTVDAVIRGLKERGEMPSQKETTAAAAEKHELMRVGSKESVSPESVANMLTFPTEGQDAVESFTLGWKTSMMTVFGVARLLQVLNAGQAETVKNQLEIFKAAQEGSDQKIERITGEFARAVQGDHAELLEAFKSQQYTESPNPMSTMMKGVFTKSLEPVMTDMLGRVFGKMTNRGQPQFQQGQPVNQEQGQQDGQPMQEGQPPQEQEMPQNIEERTVSDSEWEEYRNK